MKAFDWLKNLLKGLQDLFSALFHRPPDSPSQQKHEKFCVEPIKFPSTKRSSAIYPDLVIDFGTTATVVGEVYLAFPDVDRRKLDLLVGGSEFKSEMSIAPGGKISAVGPGAYLDQMSKPDHVHFTSMKRYLELASRGGASMGFHTIVRDFLMKAVGEQYRSRRPLGPTSEIVISVPNSFNPRAVEDIRKGVVYAINDLNEGRQDLAIDYHNVKLVRESEAVAYLYSRQGGLSPAPTMENDVPIAPFTWDSLHSANAAQDGAQRMIVLDVGGGTTDLSVVEVDPQAASDRAVKVILNAGVALGGTDVDNLLFRGLLDPKVDLTKDYTEWLIGRRIDLLSEIRALKDANGDQIFKTPDPGRPDEFRRTLSMWLNDIPEAARRFSPGQGECSEEDTRAYRAETGKRLKKLIRLSVTGLFELLPKSATEGVSTILLTGRAARLDAIRQSVIEYAEKLGAEVKCPHYPYHAKLVVAYGCALINNDEFSGTRLPAGTLGRRFQVILRSNGEFSSFEADFPISQDAPTVLQARLPGHQNHARSYIAGESKTVVPNEFFDETNDYPKSQDYMEWLGCGRAIAGWNLKPSQAQVTKFLLWHPENETYYTIEDHHWRDLKPQRPFSWSDLNYVTGLPLGFPYQEMERKLGSKKEAGRAS